MEKEELQEELLKQKEENAKLLAQYNEEKSKNEKLTEDNKRLVEYNNKLFMRVTEPVENKENKEKQKDLTPEEQEEELIKDIRKIMHREV